MTLLTGLNKNQLKGINSVCFLDPVSNKEISEVQIERNYVNMLTPEQINKLQTLTSHPKFGKLLIDAIIIWMYAIPKRETWGVIDHSDSNLVELTKENCCCLIGAASVGKPNQNIRDLISDYFEISFEDYASLMCGFDGDRDLYGGYHHDDDAYSFGRNVARIVFSECD